MIAILLLSVIVSAPPQAPPVRAVPPQAPTVSVTYADVRALVANGMTVVVYAGVPLPAKAEPNAVRVDAIPGEPKGIYDCYRGGDQLPKMVLRSVAAQPATSPYRDAPGTHRHRCPTDGTIWSHTPGGSHACPTCGRESAETRKHYTGPDAPTAKPVPAKPKRISMNGRWYDQYPDGRLVECST